MSLSKEQIDEMNEAFNLYDIDNDGLIPTSHVGSVLRSLGVNITDIELTNFSQKHGDTINKQVFTDLMTEKLSQVESEDEFIKAFAVFDRDNTGMIETSRFAEYMTNLGEKLPTAEVQAMIQEADPNNTGSFNYREFVIKILSK
ncbi:myosin I light chain Cam2 [Schizosaccharomyces japonicus yFS275]|uniref:Myosin I light chain Cam2 n=1 Tax=Schizosaccharomyces japonicus (strain yFS275 / FY16936) TaxID=402676 RepID=B6K7R4_SCHJY|nr:myosin I light chain Cam2 [Schizosaccharomyces japonicus yFS275]EEB09568.1 myosin I light chain Cam2 [Schizosaccharomyces japonicus yFS275]